MLSFQVGENIQTKNDPHVGGLPLHATVLEETASMLQNNLWGCPCPFEEAKD